VIDGFVLLLAERGESVLRLCLAAGLGAIIGLEREASGKAAGFRTNLLICLGAALITELSAEVARDGQLPGGLRSDPGRIAAQIVSGIGFLGAGTILQSRGSVTGLTTAATLWVVAAIGMAVGAGAYVHAIVGTGLVMLALMILGRFGDQLPRREDDRLLRVTVEPRNELVPAVQQLLLDGGLQIRSLDVEKHHGGLVVSCRTGGSVRDVEIVMRQLLDQPGVRKVSLL
jgi:putative Mg2+ transporter-C (MgtC) family protein